MTETFTYGYDSLSRWTQLQRQRNGTGLVTTDYEYDEISRLKRLKHTQVSTGTLHEDFQYEYNLDDEITKISSLASAPLAPQSKTATIADAANRIGQFGTASYSFNQEGQTTAKTDASGTTNYQWDSRGRLTRATLPNGQSVDYGYDVLGRRVNRSVNGFATTFQYDGMDIIIDRENSGNAYDYLNGLGIDDKLRQKGGAWGTFYFLQDHLGGTAGLAGSGGSLVETLQQFEPFGDGSGSARTRYGYTGREQDDLTGLIYYRARWHESRQGRFISEDPVGISDGLNLYAYVGNNPLMYRDPTGNQREYDSKRFHDFIPLDQSSSPSKKDQSLNDDGTKCCINLFIDAAGRKCCAGEEKPITMWNINNERVPHTFLQTPNMVMGFYPASVFAILPPTWGSGIAQDNRDYLRKEKMFAIKYKACPKTIRELEKSILRNLSGDFNIVNINGHNCTGWACARLEDAGITPPLPSWWPYSNPWLFPVRR